MPRTEKSTLAEEGGCPLFPGERVEGRSKARRPGGQRTMRGLLPRLWAALLLLISLHRAIAKEPSAKDTQAGQKLYNAKCAKCHKFYDPKAYEQREWDAWMEKMRKKSKLSRDQFELVSRYIDTTLRTDKKAEKK